MDLLDGVSVENIAFANNYKNETKTGFLNYSNCINAYAKNIHMNGSDSAGLQLGNTVDSIMDNVKCIDFTNNQDSGRYGYGINVVGACQNIIVNKPIFRKTRHGFTTDGVNGGWGVPRHIKIIKGLGIDGGRGVFDTHPTGEDITFDNCTVVGSKPGADGTTYGESIGFQIRCKDVKLINPKVNNADWGIWLDQFTSGVIIDRPEITNTKVIGIHFRPSSENNGKC